MAKKDNTLKQVMDMNVDIMDALSEEQLKEMHHEITKLIFDRIDMTRMDDETRKAVILLAHDHQLYEGMLIQALLRYKKMDR